MTYPRSNGRLIGKAAVSPTSSSVNGIWDLRDQHSYRLNSSWQLPLSPISNGLTFLIDPANSSSYPGSGSIIYNTVDNSQHTLMGTYSYNNGSIRLTNTNSTDPTQNLSYIQCGTISNIVTVSLWFYLHSAPAIWRYLLDAREGGSGGWFAYSAGDALSFGPDWTGSGYVNGGSYTTIPLSALKDTGVWRNVTVQAVSGVTDDINLFSRFSDNEGLDVTMGPVLIYNRALTEAENLQNFNVFRTRYGL